MSIQEKVLKTRTGKNFSQVIGQNLVKDWYEAVSEFICNSYDEDSENVNVNIDPKSGMMEIIDDGLGMDREGLVSFFRKGESKKIKEPLSPIKKRKRVGKKGIAKTLARYLSNSLRIESVKDEIKYIVEDAIIPDNEEIKVLPINLETRVDSGTLLRFNHLKFDFGKVQGFSIDKLYNRLEWSVPIDRDFDVFVNGLLVKKRSVQEYSACYRVNKTISPGKTIKGLIYYTKKPNKKNRGVMIFVNKRRVCDGDLINLADISMRLPNHIHGEIDADYLEDLITLDREKFKDDERIDEISQEIKQVLYSINEDILNGQSARSYYAADKLYLIVETGLNDAENELSLKEKIDYKLRLTSRRKSGSLAKKVKNIININAENRIFSFVNGGTDGRINKIGSKIYLKNAFLIACSYALSENNENEEFAHLIEQNAMERFNSLRPISQVCMKYLGRDLLIPINDIKINPYRMYEAMDLSMMSGRPYQVIRQMMVVGTLIDEENLKFSSEQIKRVLGNIEGYTSCIELVDERFTKTHRHHLKLRLESPVATWVDEQLASNKFEKFDSINVGRNLPMYFIKDEYAKDFKQYVIQRQLKK